MDNHAKVKKLASLAAEKARLIAKLGRTVDRLREVATEECDLLCAGYTANAAVLGLDPEIDPALIEPKD